MDGLTMVVLAPFYVLTAVGTGVVIGTMLMYLVDAVRKQLQNP